MKKNGTPIGSEAWRSMLKKAHTKDALIEILADTANSLAVLKTRVTEQCGKNGEDLMADVERLSEANHKLNTELRDQRLKVETATALIVKQNEQTIAAERRGDLAIGRLDQVVRHLDEESLRSLLMANWRD